MVRLFMLISISLALAGAPQAASQDAIQLQDAGELFAQRCADCHGARAISAWGRKMPNEEQRRQWLEGFLQNHHSPPVAEHAPIIAYIQSQIVLR